VLYIIDKFIRKKNMLIDLNQSYWLVLEKFKKVADGWVVKKLEQWIKFHIEPFWAKRHKEYRNNKILP
jgi:hypothetical protein